ncbi:MAG: hypothetical protein AAGJ87_01630 [Pseudomonadota bacterium]
MKRDRVVTRLVAGVVVIVALLGVVFLVLHPQRLLAGMTAIAFLPVALILAPAWCRRRSETFQRRHVGKLRAGVAGAGVIIATALFLSIADTTGLIPSEQRNAGQNILVSLPAIIVVLSEFLSDWLSRKAEK